MAARFSGSFVISWSQVEVDGLPGARVGSISVGSTWQWQGQATRVDDVGDIFVPERSLDDTQMRRRAAKHLKRVLGNSIGPLAVPLHDVDGESLFKSGFELTDGRSVFRATIIELGPGKSPLLLFDGCLPPNGVDLWVVTTDTAKLAQDPREQAANGTVCFTPGTMIATPNGPVNVQDLSEGDEICTKDNGPQVVRWVGLRNVSGGRLVAMPSLRPIRIRAHFLGDGEPDQDLYLSPDHRLLVKGETAQSLFNCHEVLVTARDLVNDSSILPDFRCRGVTYIHLMLDQHQVVWANGVEVESFHPAGMDTNRIDPEQRHDLFEKFPDIHSDPNSYGEFARRSLSQSEAALLSYGAFGKH